MALFDVAPGKVDRLIDGCRCYASRDIEQVLAGRDVLVGIVAVPPEAAQEVADRLVHAGVRGLMNFTPVRLRVPPEVFVEDVDISVSLERVSFFARSKLDRQEMRA